MVEQLTRVQKRRTRARTDVIAPEALDVIIEAKLKRGVSKRVEEQDRDVSEK